MDEVIPDPNEYPTPSTEPPVTERLKNWYKALPDKKRYAEFFSAILTIPVLITVIILNINSLNAQKSGKSAVPTPATTIINIIQPTPTPSATITPAAVSPTPTAIATPTPTPLPTPTPSPTPSPTQAPTPPPATSSGTLQ